LQVLKWGGVLTHAGRKQAEVLGAYFRANMYPRCEYNTVESLCLRAGRPKIKNSGFLIRE
jgi:hypothetical protein